MTKLSEHSFISTALLPITPGMSPRQARKTNPTFPSMLASKTGGKWGLSLPLDTAGEVPTMTSTVYLAFKTRVATTPLIFDSNCLPLPESELI